jgi:hypothetical protein
VSSRRDFRSQHRRPWRVGRGNECGKPITADEPPVFTKSFFNPIVVQDCEGDRCLPVAPWADESDKFEVFSEFDDLLNQIVASETVPRWRGRQFTDRHAMKT